VLTGGARLGGKMPTRIIVPALQQGQLFGFCPNNRSIAAAFRAALSRFSCAFTFNDSRAFAKDLPFDAKSHNAASDGTWAAKYAEQIVAKIPVL